MMRSWGVSASTSFCCAMTTQAASARGGTRTRAGARTRQRTRLIDYYVYGQRGKNDYNLYGKRGTRGTTQHGARAACMRYPRVYILLENVKERL